MEFMIPEAHWTDELHTILKHAGPGDVIVVPNEDRGEMVRKAMEMHNVQGVEILVYNEDSGEISEFTRTRCPDSGKSHHSCTDRCYRVLCCSPLSGVYTGNAWPPDVLAANQREDPSDG
jgi:hypothetical protein